MSNNGFESKITLKETPSFKVIEEKPLNIEKNLNKKVDINILKARAQEIENKEGRKNITLHKVRYECPRHSASCRHLASSSQPNH